MQKTNLKEGDIVVQRITFTIPCSKCVNEGQYELRKILRIDSELIRGSYSYLCQDCFDKQDQEKLVKL